MLVGKLYNWDEIPFENIGAGIERQMIVGEKMMICRLRFAPKTITPAHRHPHEQMTIVEKGKVLFTLEDEQQVFAPGDVLHFPSNFWHGATMLDDEVILIDIFSPIREDFLSQVKVEN
jgi:quercetin dioxygenase-like cupin family protein